MPRRKNVKGPSYAEARPVVRLVNRMRNQGITYPVIRTIFEETLTWMMFEEQLGHRMKKEAGE